MKELLAKIRGSKDDTKCQSVAEVYVEVNQVLEELDGKFEGIDVTKFDAQLDQIEQILDELKELFVPPEIRKLLETLETRFRKSMQRHEGVTWQQVKQRLKGAPPEKLQSLLQMEKTGGEPDVMKIDEKTGEIVFYDCSEESPTGRRKCVYDKEAEEYLKKNRANEKWNGNAVDMAKTMGVDLLTESEYRELQGKGEFDKNSWCWLKTPVDKRRTGFALDGRRGDDVYVHESLPYYHHDTVGWRGLLRV